MSQRRLAALIAALFLLSPVAALAQSAGDEQYQDPFAEEAQATPSPTEAPPLEEGIPTAEPTPAPASGPGSGTAAEESEAGPSLPATGGEAALIALLGGGMLLAGAGLRMTVRAADERGFS